MKLKFFTVGLASLALVASPVAANTAFAAPAQEEAGAEDGAGAGTWVIAIGALAALGLGIYAAADNNDGDDAGNAPVSP